MQLGGVFWAIVGNINSPGEIAAMTLAIMTFCVVCALVDHALAQRHLITLRIRLVIAVYVKMALQFYPAIEPSAGIVALASLELLGLDKLSSVVTAYLISVIVALLLCVYGI